jgi:uncharacterized protein (DUF2147 family)
MVKRPLLPLFLVLGVALASLFSGAAMAADPEGEWLVAERTAQIKIADCGGTLWGIVSWEANPGLDEKNPNPAERGRPTLRMPVLLGMTASGPNQWAGRIYNSDNGKTYSGGLTLVDADVLRVRGCIFGFLCGGENWTRVDSRIRSALSESGVAICSRLNAPFDVRERRTHSENPNRPRIP